MKAATSFITAVCALAATTTASETMSVLRKLKLDTWSAQSEAGIFDIDRYAAQAATACVNGKAGEYRCNKVDLVSFLRHQDMGSSTRRGNDIWGKVLNLHPTSSVQQLTLHPRMDLLDGP
jgi:hypothetical protein